MFAGEWSQKVDFLQDHFKNLKIDSKDHMLAESVIISTGAGAKWLGIP